MMSQKSSLPIDFPEEDSCPLYSEIPLKVCVCVCESKFPALSWMQFDGMYNT